MAGLSRRKISQYEKIITPNSAYFKTLKKADQRYLRILCKDWPAWLDKYIATPEMKRLKFIGQACGTDYTTLYHHHAFYDVLDHSVATALIVWNFTKDKKQTLAALFHDISTPVFKHCIDFLNGDAEKQESTEKKTREVLENSSKIIKLLAKDEIDIKEIDNYHLYPIADNDMPRLSSDRLEYSLMCFHKCGYPLHFSMEQVERFYNDIEVGKDENGAPELAFKDFKIAEDFVLGLAKGWPVFCDEKWRFTASFLATVVENLIEEKLLTEDTLYHLTEREVLGLIKKSKNEKLKEDFQKFRSAKRLKKADRKPNKVMFIARDQKIKKRYIDPLVRVEVNISVHSGEEEIRYARLSKISPKAEKAIKDFKSRKFAKYAYI